MHGLRKQRTLQKPAAVAGFGYWSGQDIRVEFRPAAQDRGIVFVRHDLQPAVSIEACIENRIETPLRTTLTAGGASVEMVEHVLSALHGLQIDNCEVWVDAAEMPGMDGSALPFVEALDAAGSCEQDALRPQLIIHDITRLGDDQTWIEASPSEQHCLQTKYRLDYGNDNPVGRQTLEAVVTPDFFRKQLAPCRTFMFKQEADWLLEQGLGTRVTPQDLIVFSDMGPIDNSLRFEDECVRHKMLDLVGDLALAGCDLIGKIVAHRSGHRLNAELVRTLLAEEQVLESRRQAV